MFGIVELEQLLKSMSPQIQAGEYVFCTVKDPNFNYGELSPLCIFQEEEGTTLILTVEQAQQANLPFEGTFKQITLTVHSSLEAVGLTAAIAQKLTDYGISANVVAAYYHDHVFVPSSCANKAMLALQEFNQ